MYVFLPWATIEHVLKCVSVLPMGYNQACTEVCMCFSHGLSGEPISEYLMLFASGAGGNNNCLFYRKVGYLGQSGWVL